MMADNNRNLVNNVTPIYYWTKVQQNENDTGKLIEWTNKFIATELSTNDIYQNRIGRYALLIYQVISQKKELKSLAEQLFKTTINKLKLNQVNVNVDSASRLVLAKRTWYRYLYAYSNYIQANKALEIGNNKEAGEGFKTAFDYSPDLTDKNNSSAYFYDMFFLLEKDKRTFQDDYLDYLAKHSEDKKRTLSTLLTMALTNPTYKEQLKTFYSINFPDQEGFNDYWMKNSSKNLKNAPDISIKKTDGLLFSSAANKGKWILIDFWGTWCSPCRKEHPDLEKFYHTIKSSLSNKITLLTVACKDKEDKVSSYMSQFNYSFPVAMADNEIENVYNVKSYPSKILISPQGKYLIVPFGVDWVDFVKKYADL